MRRLATTGLAAGLLLAAAPLTTQAYAASAPSAARAAVDPSTPDGTYTGVAPTRLFDSSTALKRQLNPGEVVDVKVTGRAGVPASGVSAAVVNLTVDAPSRPGYLAAYPSDSSGDGVSSINFAARDTRAALVTVPVGADGSIKIRNATAANGIRVRAIVDVQGYYSAKTAAPTATQAGFFPSAGSRLLDTRQPGPNGEDLTLRPYDINDIDLRFYGGTSAENKVEAVALNLTAVDPTGPGYLVAWNGLGDPPDTSNVNFVRGATTPNNAVVPVQHTTDDKDGKPVSRLSIGNGSAAASVDVVVDYVGVYTRDEAGELRFQPLSSPVRIVNTRTSTGFGPLNAKSTGTATAPSSVAVPGTTAALVGTLVGVAPTAATYLTAWPDDEDRPGISNLNPARGQTVANHAVIGLSEAAKFDVYNFAGRTDVVYDVTGRFDVPGSSSAAAQRRLAAESQRDLSDPEVSVTRRHRG